MIVNPERVDPAARAHSPSAAERLEQTYRGTAATGGTPRGPGPPLRPRLPPTWFGSAPASPRSGVMPAARPDSKQLRRTPMIGSIIAPANLHWLLRASSKASTD